MIVELSLNLIEPALPLALALDSCIQLRKRV
jgi:hypothetical protein